MMYRRPDAEYGRNEPCPVRVTALRYRKWATFRAMGTLSMKSVSLVWRKSTSIRATTKAVERKMPITTIQTGQEYGLRAGGPARAGERASGTV